MSRRIKEHKRRQREQLAKGLGEAVPRGKRQKVVEPDSDSGEETRQWRDQPADDEPAGTALPIRTATGQWRASGRNTAPAKTKQDDAEDSGNASEAESPSSSVPSSDDDDESPQMPDRSFAEIKRELATLAIAITEDGESNVGKLKEMLAYLDVAKYPADVVRLALLSVLAVIKDILPGYYVRPVREGEGADSKLSKDVKQIRTFEESILSSYKRFFAFLRETIVLRGRRRHKKSQLPVLQMALTCVHELMVFASHFNHFEDVLKVAAHALTLPFADEVARTAEAFKRLFQTDEQGHVTFLAARLLSNMIKEAAYDCPAAWLTALETVRIRADVAARRSAVDARKHKVPQHMSTRARKEWKAKQEELRKMAEAEIVVSREELSQWNRETLKHLFRVYFGILRHNPTPALLPPVLAGLARHSHRIGVEYFADLLQSLRRILADDTLALVPALHCILTVDRIHAINENLAAMDLKVFYNALFVQLGRLRGAPDACVWDEAKQPLQACLSALFHPKRTLPAVRVAAFAQRLADVAAAFGARRMEGPAVFMLDALQTLLTHHTKAQSVLDREPFGQGVYLIECADPDLCNPYTRSLYDVLVALRNGLASQAGPAIAKLRTLIEAVLKLAPSTS